jgi:hypothetical protein
MHRESAWIDDPVEEGGGEVLIDGLRAPGKIDEEAVDLVHQLQRRDGAEGSGMDEAVDQGHDHRGMQAMPGDIADKERLTVIGHVDDIEVVAAEPGRHAVLDAAAAPVAGRRTLGQQQLLHLLGQVHPFAEKLAPHPVITESGRKIQCTPRHAVIVCHDTPL